MNIDLKNLIKIQSIRKLSSITIAEFKEYFKNYTLNGLEFISVTEYHGGDTVLFEFKYQEDNPKLNLADGYSYNEFAISIIPSELHTIDQVLFLINNGFSLGL